MSAHSLSTADFLARAAALSLYCGAEGQINLHKLLEAAIYSISRRRAAGHTVMTFADLAPTIAELRTLGVAPELVDALEQGAEIARTGGVPMADATPDVFVCRVCGHTALAAAPERCPACGAWPATFRRFMGIFNVDNPDPLASLALLAQGPDAVESLIGDLAEEITTRTPAPGEWSIQRALQHLVDAQDVFAGRLERMLTEEHPPVAVEFVWTVAGQTRTTQELLADFRRKRAATVARLEELPMKAWGRTGRHEEFGTVTVLHQAGYFAYHEAFHYPDFVVKRRQLGVPAG
jgi:uncharacterized damage-inducible protein DinB